MPAGTPRRPRPRPSRASGRWRSARPGPGSAAPVVLLGLFWAVALVGWFASDGGSHGTTRSALRIGADAWLLAHGAHLQVGAGTVSAVPLGLSLLCAWGAFRAGRWAGATSEVEDLMSLGLGAIVLGGTYASLALVTAVLAASPAAAPDPLLAFLGGALVGGTAGGLGLVVGLRAARRAAGPAADPRPRGAVRRPGRPARGLRRGRAALRRSRWRCGASRWPTCSPACTSTVPAPSSPSAWSRSSLPTSPRGGPPTSSAPGSRSAPAPSSRPRGCWSVPCPRCPCSPPYPGNGPAPGWAMARARGAGAVRAPRRPRDGPSLPDPLLRRGRCPGRRRRRARRARARRARRTVGRLGRRRPDGRGRSAGRRDPAVGAADAGRRRGGRGPAARVVAQPPRGRAVDGARGPAGPLAAVA